MLLQEGGGAIEAGRPYNQHYSVRLNHAATSREQCMTV